MVGDEVSELSRSNSTNSSQRRSAHRSRSLSSLFSLGRSSFLKRKREEEDEGDEPDQEQRHDETEESMMDAREQDQSDTESGEGEVGVDERQLRKIDEKIHRNRVQRSSSSESTSPPSKRAKTEGDAESEAREKKLDDELPEEYRKYRPRGYRFNVPPKDRDVRIYADGVFDLFHLGHMKQLEQAKKALPRATLVVGIPSDKDTHKYKGLTVLSDEQRVETLRHCKWVDEVIPNSPWQVSVEFLKKHKIDYVAHDDLPYASNGDDDIYRPVKELGMFLTTQRTEGISTSDIITHIIRDYDKYLMRNFSRGASRKDLNVSWLKKNELDLKRHVLQFRESFKKQQGRNPGPRDLYSEFMGYISNALHLNNNNNNNNNSDAGFFDNFKDWVAQRIDASHPPSSDDSD